MSKEVEVGGRRPLFDLTGQVAWVIGGAGYLGLPACRGLAQYGAHIILADRRSDAIEPACATLRAENLSVEPMSLDIADEVAIRDAADAIARRHGRLDICVNTAWHYTGKSMEELTVTDIERGLRVSLTGAFLVGREAGRIMRPQRRGSIIQFSSMYGVVSPDPRIYPPDHQVNPPDYGMAKAAILQWVRYQAVMLAPDNVRVNAIVPGPFPHPGGQGADQAFLKRLAQKVPMGRVGSANETAGAVVFLASDASSYVTGTQIVVDGGWTAW